MIERTNSKDGERRGQEWSRRSFLRTGLAATAGTVPAASYGLNPARRAPDLAFFVVGDTHYEARPEAPDELDEHILGVNRRAIDLLNALPGQRLPKTMGGGEIARPAGLIHVGDMIETGDKGSGKLSVDRQETEWEAYVADYGLDGTDGRLKFPVYEVHGNHDSVRETNVVIKGMHGRNRKRPGVANISKSKLHYSWDWAGMHFIALGIVVGHNDKDLPIGRYKAHDSLQFLREDLEDKIGDSGRPVVLIHHIDLLRYSSECTGQSEHGGEWSACDVAAYHQAIQGYNVSAIFHGHLHALRADRWAGTTRSEEVGIPVFGTRNTGAGGSNRGFFYCALESEELVVREMVSLGTPDGWEEGRFEWSNEWKVPVRNREA